MHVTCDAGERTVEGDTLLVAAGRLPNGDQIDAHVAGIEVGPIGNVVVDLYGRTSAPGVWALGDVNGRHQLKHMANGEAKAVQHNLLHPDDLRAARHPSGAACRVRQSAGRRGRADRGAGRGPRTTDHGDQPTRMATPRTAGRWKTPAASAS